MSEVETARLNLRLIKLGDEQYIFPVVDEELTRYWIDWEPPQSMEQVRSDIEKTLRLCQEGKKFHFLGFTKADKEFIGLCGIAQNFAPYEAESEIDVWVKKEAQGRGYATEMVAALIPWVQTHLKLPYLVYSITEGNNKSESIIKHYNAPVLRRKIYMKRGVPKNVTDYKIDLE
jgi:RimJ/RimL family protein N-acetyltransferase